MEIVLFNLIWKKLILSHIQREEVKEEVRKEVEGGGGGRRWKEGKWSEEVE